MNLPLQLMILLRHAADVSSSPHDFFRLLLMQVYAAGHELLDAHRPFLSPVG